MPQTLQWFVGKGGEPREDLRVRGLEAGPFHSSFVLAERMVLKVLRSVSSGIRPEVEIGRFLAERVSFAHAPRLAAWLEARIEDDDDPITLAVLREHVPGGQCARLWTQAEVERYFDHALESAEALEDATRVSLAGRIALDPSAPAPGVLGALPEAFERLGHRTAELHLVLSQEPQDPAFAPEPYSTLDQRSTYQALRSASLVMLRHLRHRTAELELSAEELRSWERRILARLAQFWQRPLTAARLRHHGDYRLERVLCTGSEFWIRDFGGDATRTIGDRRRKQSPLRDVAGLLWSFSRVVEDEVCERRTRERQQRWNARLVSAAGMLRGWVSRAFLRGYLSSARDSEFLPRDHSELELLLDVFSLERAVRELDEVLDQRGERVRGPLQALREILETVPEPSGERKA
jgi:maltose alpha-D-glucosyltransferase/alpha-amylase